jgi:phosphate butyryltransferase
MTQQITDFASLRAAARRLGGNLTLAMVAATDEASIRAAVAAFGEGIATSILLGDETEIRQRLEQVGAHPRDFRLEPCESDREAAQRAAALAARGEANAIIKGRASSRAVMQAVLDRAHGLRTGAALSDVRLYEHPLLTGRFLGLTDGGVIPFPTLEQKRGIIDNAVQVYHRLGFHRPRVALLAASEKVSEGIPHTLEARALTDRYRRSPQRRCVVDGPLSFDLALVPEAAVIKGYQSEVAGRAEVLVGPNIETINVLAKALVYLHGAVPGQVVMGARVPVLIASRADSAAVKLNSVALAALMAAGGT